MLLLPFRVRIFELEVEAEEEEENWASKAEEGKEEVEHTQRMLYSHTITIKDTCKLLKTFQEREQEREYVSVA